MGVNGPNLQDLFNQRFGAGSYEAGINNAYNAGRAIYNARQQAIQQQLFEQYQKQMEAQQKEEAKQRAQEIQDRRKDPMLQQQNANSYWSNPQMKQDLLQNGAFRTVKDLMADPEKIATLKSQGYDINAIADQAYNVASDGKYKSAKAFNQYYKDLSDSTKDERKANLATFDQDAQMHAAQVQAQQQAQDTPSFFDRAKTLGGEALDLIGRPLNAVETGISDTLNGGNFLQGAKEGLLGQRHTSGTQLLSQIGLDPNKNDTSKVLSRLLGNAVISKLPLGSQVAPWLSNTLKQNIGQQTAGYGVDTALDPLNALIGAGEVSNLAKGSKLLEATNSLKYDPAAFEQALKDSFAPKGNVSNVLSDAPKEMPKPFEQKYNIPQLTPQVKPQVNADVLKQSDWFGFGQQGNNLSRGIHVDPTVPKGESGTIRSLAEDTLNRSNALNNAPSGGFNQRLLDVQREMQGPHKTNTNVQNEFKDAVQKQYEYLKGSMGKGTDSGVYTNGKAGNFKEATGGRYSVSNNDKWYQDFYKQNGRPPSNKELRKLAEEHVRNGFQDNLGDIPAWKPQELQHVHNQIDELHSMMVQNPEQSHVIAPILKGLEQDEARLTAAHNNALNGKNPNINDLYLGAKGAKDPKNIDELIKLAQMEHNAANPGLKTMLHTDSRVKQQLDALNSLGKGATKKAETVKQSNVLKGLNIPELKGPQQQNIHDLLKAAQVDRSIKPGGNGLLMPLKPTVLESVKVNKSLHTMSKGELQDIMSKLEKQESLAAGDETKLKAIESDKKKVSDLMMKLDLQQFGANAEKLNPIEAVREKLKGKTPEKTPQQAAIERSQQEAAAKKIQEKGGTINADTVREMQKIKDIKPHQTLGMNLYEVADKLPKEMGDRIKSALDTGKANHMANLEKRSNELYDKVVQELGIKKGSKESALVQDFGEKTLAKNYLEKKGEDPSKLSKQELDKINLEQLKAQHPNNWQKIVEADKFFRDNYNKLIDEVNATVKQIYPKDPDKIVPKREDYYHHFNELEGFEGFKDFLHSDNHIDPHLAGISPFTRPKTKFAGFKLARGDGEYKSDAVGGYLKYLQAASHSTHVDPVIPVIRNAAEQLATATEGTKNAHYLKAALEYHANDLAGKTNPVDRLLQDHLLGRKGMQLVNTVNGHIKKNMILGNVGSLVGQIGNIPLTLGKAKQYAGQGTLDTLKDMAIHLIPGATKDASAPINQSQFLKERFKGQLFSRFDMGLLKKPEKAAAWMLETADKTSTYLAWNSMYRKALAKGVADPIKFADTEARHIVAGRGIGEVPIYQKSKLTGLIAPFSLEVGNTWKVLGKQMGEKDFGGVITFLVTSAVLNEGMRQVRGSDVSFNPIGAALDGINKDKTASATDKAKLAGANVLGEIAGNIPGGSYIPQILGMKNAAAKKAIFGDNSPDRFGTGVGVTSGAFNPITDLANNDFKAAGYDALKSLVLPFGGNQAQKTAKGIEALVKGGAYDKKGRLEYPVDSNNFADLLHSLLLGPSTTGQGQKYFQSNGRALSDKDTAAFQNMQQMGQGQTYFDGVTQKRAISAIDKQIKTVMKDPGLSPLDKQRELMRLQQVKLQAMQK